MKHFPIYLICALFAAQSYGMSEITVKLVKKDGTVNMFQPELIDRPDGAKRVKIAKNDIKDCNSISIFSEDFRAEKGCEGYWILGDGRLGSFKADDGLLTERRNPLPVYGVKKGDKAYFAIVKGLKYEFAMNVDVKGGVYNVFPTFILKDVPAYQSLIVDFYELSGADANYSKMARIYREYQLGRKEVIPLKERAANNPQLAYTAESIFVRIMMGAKNNSKKIENQTPENEPKVNVCRTFDDVMRIMRELKKAGVDKAEVCLVGWCSGGQDGRFPTLFPADPAYGGTEKMREAIAFGKSLGYQMTCHVCNTDFYKISDRFNEADVARQADGSLMRGGGIASGGRPYGACFKRVYEAYIEDDYAKMAEVGIKGTLHVDVTSCITPYPCYDPNHYCTRNDTAEYMNKVAQRAREVFGGFGSEGPCDHIARTLDFILYVSAYPRWCGANHPLMDKIVPLWQLVYHGIIVSNPFYATIDYNYDKTLKHEKDIADAIGGKVERRLKLYEFGGRPIYYNQFTERNLVPVKTAYDEYEKYKYLQYEFMDSHSEIAPKVFLTEYSDGSKVVTNYTDADFKYNGEVVKAKDFKLFKK